MQVIKISPRGYCYGVVDAIQLVRRAAADPSLPRPLYVLGQIVHNQHVVDELAQLGVITLDGAERESLLEQVEAGTVIFTAHGVSPQVKERARRKGLRCIDATCPDVEKTHAIMREKAAAGYAIIYIGKRGHPEPEGALGEAPGQAFLLETEDDLPQLLRAVPPGERPVAVVTQTTLSQWDTQHLIDLVRRHYPAAEVYNEICLATQLRQEAVARDAAAADLVLVVGDRRSNNSNRLVQVAREIAGKEAHLVSRAAEIDPAWLRGKTKVAVTAGSSTPTWATREVIEFLERYADYTPSTW